ncbi:MAG: 3-deoxy-8-phosphooctulonate synthase [Alphaproteobacteria bacterium]|nr:3-deoxy-8-phosphooctulonate synthase [Alphaproteobacteria bacterium]MBQ8347177.1 3-deoxy-8-phosphooctulonate synthase [Alphaproteobacteria bacterium]
MQNRRVSVGNITFSNDLPFVLIGGPCQLESMDHTIDLAGKIVEITGKLNIPYVFKASFDKANRTSISGARGVGLEKAMDIFKEVKKQFSCPVITDVHEPGQCAPVAQVVDMLQIPAFLCRQTDLVVAAAKTGKPLNIKKGQFLAPWDMKNVVTKADQSGNTNVLVTERGVSFGYNTLVVDMRSLPIMAQQTGCPVVIDATHSVQQPGGQGTSTGGQREFAPVLARAAVAVGVAGVFIETHQDPDKSPSDGPNMIPLAELEGVLASLKAIDQLIKGY